MFTRLTGNARRVHLFLVGAVVLNIIGTTNVNSSKESDIIEGKTMKVYSAIMFVVFTLFLVLRCASNLRGNTPGAHIFVYVFKTVAHILSRRTA